jgi:hypothetical protein
MNIFSVVLISVTALLFIFLLLVVILKLKNNLTWKSAFREAIEYILFAF